MHMPKRPPHTTRVAFSSLFVTTLFLAIAMAMGSCSLADMDECESGQDYCSPEGVAYACGSLPTTLARKGWRTTRCRDARHCRVDANGAFCTLSDETDDRCVFRETDEGYVHQFFCDGDMHVQCRSAFPTRRTLCTGCSEEGGGCDVVQYRKCDEETPCPPPLVCDSRSPRGDGNCLAPCDCEEGEECPACNFLGGEAESRWVCKEERCRRQKYGD